MSFTAAQINAKKKTGVPRRPPFLRALDKFTVGDECWVWHGARQNGGYGVIAKGGKVGPKILAHRLVYEVLVGRIPEGLDLDHLCRNRACVRPDHLEPVTRSENLCRGVGPAMARARAALRTSCRRGHSYDYTFPNGARGCKECRREANRRWTERQKVGA